MACPLRFDDVDHLGFAAERGKLDELVRADDFRVDSLGPFVEYALLGAASLLPRPSRAPWLKLGSFARFYRALRASERVWVCPETHKMGVFRMSEPQIEELAWVQFRLEAQRAAMDSGFARDTSAQFAGALGELYSNIYEHCGAPKTGVVTFRATTERFEFAVADWGIGILASLRSCPMYSGLSDDGEALELALSDGVSRYGNNVNRGHGFQPLFTGLANINGSLRFRSGGWALTVDGRDPSRMPWRLGQKIRFKGFFASVACQVY